MLDRLLVRNFGPFTTCDWRPCRGLNVVIGLNDTGKSFLLKLAFATLRSLYDHALAKPARPWSELLAGRLESTFSLQLRGGLGDLVLRGSAEPLHVDLTVAGTNTYFSFGRDTTKRVLHASDPVASEPPAVTFIPAKEAVTWRHAIREGRRRHGLVEFDDTYLEVGEDLLDKPGRGPLAGPMHAALKHLGDQYDGEVVQADDDFVLRRNGTRLAMGHVAEGIKKLFMLQQLIANRHIAKGSVLLLDEPEANLHPQAVVALSRALLELEAGGVQVLLATHSYFLLKALEIAARAAQRDVSVVSLERAAPGISLRLDNLRDGMPPNPIVTQALELYEADMHLRLGASDVASS
ncbi:MAG: ATP-binding protein [Fimbriimonadaceae bacterium]|nr:ATP-binding protein [Fimbriimonadaceae bacterium]